ncbi:NAD(P)-binding domain-containing protein [Agrobacterium tumefaciens]|nr:NAD(P)-binding domain-containing protein [Agrobacterium tumefaciens]
MASTILVTGATGKLGQRVVSRLLQNHAEVRVLTRRREDALKLWGDRVDISEGNFSDPASLKEAARGIDRLFLLSPIGETLAADQKAVIDAALSAGVSRIVKISGSDWTIKNAARSISGAAHAEVEQHLAASGIAHAVLRPNAWMQVALEPVVAALRKGEDVPARFGDAAVSFIDADDIADVAVHALTSSAPVSGTFVLTGGEALTALEIARIAARILHRPVGISHHAAPAFRPISVRLNRRRSVNSENSSAKVSRHLSPIPPIRLRANCPVASKIICAPGWRRPPRRAKIPREKRHGADCSIARRSRAEKS